MREPRFSKFAVKINRELSLLPSVYNPQQSYLLGDVPVMLHPLLIKLRDESFTEIFSFLPPFGKKIKMEVLSIVCRIE